MVFSPVCRSRAISSANIFRPLSRVARKRSSSWHTTLANSSRFAVKCGQASSMVATTVAQTAPKKGSFKPSDRPKRTARRMIRRST